MENRVIFGWDRSGTKLLADLHSAAGYFNFGEFFNCFSCEIIYDTIPYSNRLLVETQYKNRTYWKTRNKNELHSVKSIESLERQTVFNQYKDITPSIVTVWYGDMVINKNIWSCIDDRYYLCTIRKNQTEQLLSGLLTNYNLNFNGEHESNPIHAKMHDIDYYFNHLNMTDKIQRDLVANNRGRYIDFDKLIAGQEDLGFDYTVTSSDQHTDLYKYFLNLDEVLARINYLMSTNRWYYHG